MNVNVDTVTAADRARAVTDALRERLSNRDSLHFSEGQADCERVERLFGEPWVVVANWSVPQIMARLRTLCGVGPTYLADPPGRLSGISLPTPGGGDVFPYVEPENMVDALIECLRTQLARERRCHDGRRLLPDRRPEPGTCFVVAERLDCMRCERCDPTWTFPI